MVRRTRSQRRFPPHTELMLQAGSIEDGPGRPTPPRGWRVTTPLPETVVPLDCDGTTEALVPCRPASPVSRR